MKITIRRPAPETEEIDVEFPIFYRHIIDLETTSSIIYGIITYDKVLTIDKTTRDEGDISYDFHLEPVQFCNLAHYSEYIVNPEHKATMAEFAEFATEALDFINGTAWTISNDFLLQSIKSATLPKS